MTQTKEQKAAYKRAWYERNKEKCTERARQHYLDNQDQKKEHAKKWREDNREQHRAYSSKWNQENKDAYYVRLAQWYKDNPEKRAYYKAKRKAAKLKRTPEWLSEFDLLKIKCIYQVAAMRNAESDTEWHVDHIVPLQGTNVSGLHVPWNLRVIPAAENIRKSNKFYG